MNLKFKTGLIALCSALVLATGCKKEEETTVNVLCDGGTSTSYLPLTQQSIWEWKMTGSGNYATSWTVNGTNDIDSKTYFVVKYGSSLSNAELFFRTGSDGTVYQYTNGQEYTYLPASPALNQLWAFPVSGSSSGGGFRKVTALDKSVSTSYCTYTDLLEVKEYSSATEVVTTYYYKKGLGLVRSSSLANVNNDLQAVSLK